MGLHCSGRAVHAVGGVRAAVHAVGGVRAAVHAVAKLNISMLASCTHPTIFICVSFSATQVRKEARAAIQRERDQQIALMIAK